MQMLRIIICSLQAAYNVVKSKGFQQAFQQVRHAFHSCFLNRLSELDPKPVKGDTPVACRITVSLFERQMEEDKVQPL